MIEGLIRSAVRNPVVTLVATVGLMGWGWHSWSNKTIDAIPDISENQVVVQVEWQGRSPQDVEDQVTFPLSTAMAGVRGVEEVRSLSGFGFSQVYVVFEERLHMFAQDAVDDFYESRTRVLEKLATMKGELPEGVVPELGPDATGLGQVFWYTIDGPRDLATLRSLQDFVVRYELQTVPGVAEVASVGGMPRQYQVDVDPDALRHFGVSITDVKRALGRANLDVGAKTVEQAGSEHVLRGIGFLRSLADVEDTTLGLMTTHGFVPVGAPGMSAGAGDGGISSEVDGPQAGSRGHRPLLVRDVATVEFGPEFRRGALADQHGEVVGGVVVMRFGANPRDVIDGVREVILRMNDPADGMLPPGVHITPFYDRSALIDETSETLELALEEEIWITLIVVLVFMFHVKSALIVVAGVPLAVMLTFVFMSYFGVDSNIMSLTGIAIAIGTMVDMGVVMCENIYRRVQEDAGGRPTPEVIEEAAVEVGPALVTAVATTIVSFVPIFFLTDQEGKLFRPLAWTKTFALGSAALVGVLVVPVLCRYLLQGPGDRAATGDGGPRTSRLRAVLVVLSVVGCAGLAFELGPEALRPWLRATLGGGLGFFIGRAAARERLEPIDANPVSRGIQRAYVPALRWVLANKGSFLILPAIILVAGSLVAFGARSLFTPARKVFGDGVDRLRPVAALEEAFPGIGQEFMPPLDEGVLLYMPSLLPQASLSLTMQVMQRQNAAFATVPEVARVVGKLGRVASALDPAPVGMLETVLVLQPRDLWRPGLTRADLIAELTRLGHTPGALEGAGAWLQPIETRVLMLDSGIRAPLALKLIGSPRGPDGSTMDAKEALVELERVAGELREVILEVPGVSGPNVENLASKPYTEFHVDREAAAHYGVTVGDVQEALTAAIGGAQVERTVEGRERYSLRVAYPRELRDRLDVLGEVLVRGAGGVLLPLAQVAQVETVPGPAAIKTEDGRLRLHVTFAATGRDEGSVMDDALERVAEWRAEHLAQGHPDPIPAGVSVEPAGRYESQQRARARFLVLVPICLFLIFFLLYLKFRSIVTCLNVFAAVPVCVAGGFLLIAFYPGLRDGMYAMGLWDLPSAGPVYLTVAVVVGFIALAGIATDDGVVMATYLDQTFVRRAIRGVDDIRAAVIEAGMRRIRPCLMTTFTTIFALYPILASSGRGSDVAQPMALPAVGGMIIELISLFIVPCVYCWVKEWKWRHGMADPHFDRAVERVA